METCPHCNGKGKSEANGYTLSCIFCKGKGKATVKELQSELVQLQCAYEHQIMKAIKETEEFDDACLTPIDALVKEIATLSARVHTLETKVFWINGAQSTLSELEGN
jgi:DnaJ-class molecular chaperone